MTKGEWWVIAIFEENGRLLDVLGPISTEEEASEAARHLVMDLTREHGQQIIFPEVRPLTTVSRARILLELGA